jgi:glyoxylase-like metal-dependent hydrolase (beta-lactamase superfamily II)
MSSWAQAFDVPVFVHEKDREWVKYPGPWVEYWKGEEHGLLPGVTLINVGGHFPGSAVLHWAQGAEGRGVLLAGDTVKPVMDRRYVSFMYSIVNLIPLSANEVRRISELLGRYDFDRIYSLWVGHMVESDGNAAIRRSAERYLQHIEDRS